MAHNPNPDRYLNASFRPCGKSGLKLPSFSLGLWHNFGHSDDWDAMRKIILGSFDRGITHFDLANNYGPPPGSAEENFGKILHKDLAGYRDEILITTKAGWDMWEGPYGDGGSRKYLMASLNQSLKRMNLEYVDIFYHHRPDPDTPIEESLRAVADAVRQGKALYAGISAYSGEQTQQAIEYMNSEGVPLLLHQPSYSLLNRGIETDLFPVLEEHKLGCITFSPLHQGMLSEKYIQGIPAESRAARPEGHLQSEWITEEIRQQLYALNEIAKNRNQSLSQMALAWVLRRPEISSVILGIRTPEQLEENYLALENTRFTEDEIQAIDRITLK